MGHALPLILERKLWELLGGSEPFPALLIHDLRAIFSCHDVLKSRF
jgi:hypothetical protein